MLIEIKLKIGHNSIFNISQANFKSSHLLNKMALVQSQSGRTVLQLTNAYLLEQKNGLREGLGVEPMLMVSSLSSG